LVGCSTKTIKEIKYVGIPDKYLKCNELPNAQISEEAQDEARNGDYKLYTIELTGEYLKAQAAHDSQCVANAKDARKYQKRMKAK